MLPPFPTFHTAPLIWLSRACRNKYAVSILLIDPDRFKHINDSFGHHIGDARLIQTGVALKAEVKRSGDILAREGGEEFVVFLSNTRAPEAMVVAEKLLATQQPAKADLGYPLIKKADMALYEAKRQGRNRVVAFDTSLREPAT